MYIINIATKWHAADMSMCTVSPCTCDRWGSQAWAPGGPGARANRLYYVDIAMEAGQKCAKRKHGVQVRNFARCAVDKYKCQCIAW